ncbi:MAG: tetratricopeptide repeat protein [Lachnospiraceae bacterium]|nr:tetratricopeptide repeat protein [Lachnospiraceae bacterium]
MKQKSFISLIAFASFLVLSGCAPSGADAAVIEAAKNGDYETAAAAADAAISENGPDELLYRAKGIALLGAGEYQNAEDAFLKAFSCSNGIVRQADIDISYYLAVAQYKKGDLAEAHKTVDAVIAIRPDDDGAYFLRGKIGLAMGNKDEAMSDFDRTVALAPTDYDRYVGIYEELHALGYDTEASSYLEKAMTAGNRLSDYNKGVLEYYLGSYTDARNDLENAKKSGNSENLTLYLGRTYEALGDTAYAMTLYEDYIRENSSAGKVYEQLAKSKMAAKDYEGALETIETGLSLGGGDGERELLFDRIVSYEMLYDFASAKKYMEEYVALYPDDEVARRENVFLSSR